MKQLRRAKYVGHVWISRNLSDEERKRVANAIAYIAADIKKGEKKGGIIEIEIEEDECSGGV